MSQDGTVMVFPSKIRLYRTSTYASIPLGPYLLNNQCLLFQRSFSALSPGEIRNAARDTALREISSQKSQFQSLGIMADWSSEERTYRTLGMFSLGRGKHKG